MKEIRQQYEQLKDYIVPQGSCTDGQNFYVIYEKKKPQSCKIAKYTIKGQLIQISQPLKIGHGNDITYKQGILYVTHSFGKRVLYRVNAKTLKQITDIKVNIPFKFLKDKIFAFNGITIYKNGFLLRIMNSNKMAYVEKKEDKNILSIIKIIKTNTTYEISQGMTNKDSNILRAFSYYQTGKNFIVEYNSQGQQVSVKQMNTAKGELESLFIYNNDIYTITYIKKNNKHLTYFSKIDYYF